MNLFKLQGFEFVPYFSLVFIESQEGLCERETKHHVITKVMDFNVSAFLTS